MPCISVVNVCHETLLIYACHCQCVYTHTYNYISYVICIYIYMECLYFVCLNIHTHRVSAGWPSILKVKSSKGSVEFYVTDTHLQIHDILSIHYNTGMILMYYRNHSTQNAHLKYHIQDLHTKSKVKKQLTMNFIEPGTSQETSVQMMCASPWFAILRLRSQRNPPAHQGLDISTFAHHASRRKACPWDLDIIFGKVF